MDKPKIQLSENIDFYVTYLRCLNYIEKRAKDEGKQLYDGKYYPVLFIKKEMSRYMKENFIPDDSHEIFTALYKYLENELIYYGPITSLLQDDQVAKIHIEGAKKIAYRTTNNKIIETELQFKNSVQVTKLINRFMIGKEVEFDTKHPIVDVEVENIGRVIVMAKMLHPDDDDHLTIIKK